MHINSYSCPRFYLSLSSFSLLPCLEVRKIPLSSSIESPQLNTRQDVKIIQDSKNHSSFLISNKDSETYNGTIPLIVENVVFLFFVKRQVF